MNPDLERIIVATLEQIKSPHSKDPRSVIELVKKSLTQDSQKYVNARPTQSSQPVQSSQSSQSSQSLQPAQSSQSSQSLQPAQFSQPTQSLQPTRNAQYYNPSTQYNPVSQSHNNNNITSQHNQSDECDPITWLRTLFSIRGQDLVPPIKQVECASYSLQNPPQWSNTLLCELAKVYGESHDSYWFYARFLEERKKMNCVTSDMMCQVFIDLVYYMWIKRGGGIDPVQINWRDVWSQDSLTKSHLSDVLSYFASLIKCTIHITSTIPEGTLLDVYTLQCDLLNVPLLESRCTEDSPPQCSSTCILQSIQNCRGPFVYAKNEHSQIVCIIPIELNFELNAFGGGVGGAPPLLVQLVKFIASAPKLAFITELVMIKAILEYESPRTPLACRVQTSVSDTQKVRLSSRTAALLHTHFCFARTFQFDVMVGTRSSCFFVPRFENKKAVDTVFWPSLAQKNCPADHIVTIDESCGKMSLHPDHEQVWLGLMIRNCAHTNTLCDVARMTCQVAVFAGLLKSKNEDTMCE